MTDRKTLPRPWTRREAILKAGAALGGTALIGQAAMLAGCGRPQPPAPEHGTATQEGLFSDAQLELLTEIAETILPETDTPGAKAAGVGPFIAVMVTDCYSPAEQATFVEGLVEIDRRSQDAHGENFVGLAPEQRLALAERLDREQFEASRRGQPTHYFLMLKQLTVLGFFTSEVAYNEVLEYAETPGRYEPCRELGPDVRMQAQHASRNFSV